MAFGRRVLIAMFVAIVPAVLSAIALTQLLPGTLGDRIIFGGLSVIPIWIAWGLWAALAVTWRRHAARAAAAWLASGLLLALSTWLGR
jgi:hypothetical protein